MTRKKKKQQISIHISGVVKKKKYAFMKEYLIDFEEIKEGLMIHISELEKKKEA